MIRLTWMFPFLLSCLFESECARIFFVVSIQSSIRLHAHLERIILERSQCNLDNYGSHSQDPSLTYLTEIDIHDARYDIWTSSGIILLMKEHQKSPAAIAGKYLEVYVDLVDLIMNQKDVKVFINSDVTFDLVITEPIILTGLGFVQRYNTKLIFVTSMEAPTHVHTPLENSFHPVLYPERVLCSTPNSYIKRVLITALSLYITFGTHHILQSQYSSHKKIFRG